MNQTPLIDQHRRLGAMIGPYAGWDMPITYPAGTKLEVEAVRRRAGIFDASHMGEIEVVGPAAQGFLQSTASNDITRLEVGQAQYSLLLNPDGGVIDDVIISRGSADDYLIVVNAGCYKKDLAWILKNATGVDGVRINDVSEVTALLAVQGPGAVALVESLSESTVANLRRFGLRTTSVAGVRTVVSRTGYTGEDGFELFCARYDATTLWEALVSAGAAPAGLAARNVLRLEAAYPLYGNELAEDVSPLESGVGWAVRLEKGAFVGRDAVAAARAAGPPARLAGLRLTDRAIPRDGQAVLSVGGNRIGVVTSGTYSPTLEAGIALARLDRQFATDGTEVRVDIRGRIAAAEIVRLPFYRNGV
ncbi:MAG: glycine cleavage system aminomethyltransferase GcvT [Capsulimonadaceae bacterium]